MVSRVLHVVGTLDVGGIEKWVCNMINYEKSQANEVDFYIFSSDPIKKKILSEFEIDTDKVFFSKGNGLIYRMISFISILFKIKPKAIHFHPGYSSGIYLLLTKILTKSITIVHSHSDRRNIDNSVNILRRVYIKLMKLIINNLSDHRIAVSNNAGLSLFGTGFEIHYCGVPLPSMSSNNNSFIVPGEPSYNIFHVGRFSKAKNYEFILSIAEKLIEDKNIRIYCLGEGLEYYASEAKNRGLTNIFFPGFVSDPCSVIIRHANLFIMPSLWEGLPLSVVEAQKCHIPCIVSTNITNECDIGLVKFLPLELSNWIEEIKIELYSDDKCNIILNDKFTLENNLRFFKKIYRGQKCY
ncbi:glycosyltransferase [Citrobacter sp. RHBSTW-00524]|uniref:glycosyltransferase n=1 Tax=Citrobacter sp. RHBSTW-00524 TaxID=2742653 RepID=UPI0015E9DF66|nr:glycosyltransferase [Citrobacter sp. RHBSTW-00524]QLW40686.1 glycosyltransferase [Citrobacter sp. RHBSTW-00524]